MSERLGHVMPLSAPRQEGAALAEHEYRDAVDQMQRAGLQMGKSVAESWGEFADLRARYVGLAAPLVASLFLPAHPWSIEAGPEGPGPVVTAGSPSQEDDVG